MYLPPTAASTLSSKGIETERLKKTAAREPPMTSESCNNFETRNEGKKREELGGWGGWCSLCGELIRPNGLHWNQDGHGSQMALYKRCWLSLPYGPRCNQCQSNPVHTRPAAVPLTGSRGQMMREGWGGGRGVLSPCAAKWLDICVDSYHLYAALLWPAVWEQAEAEIGNSTLG